jgi:hypothetical protein
MSCQNPDCACHNVDDPFLAKFHQEMDENIARAGRSILGVLGGEAADEFPFVYTITSRSFRNCWSSELTAKLWRGSSTAFRR